MRTPPSDVRSYNVGSSDYAQHRIQPWDIWYEYKLNPWDADIVKRVLRSKPGERRLDYEKIIHICCERIRQIDMEEVYGNDHRSEEESDCPEGTGCCAHNDADPEVQGTQAARRSG